MTNEDYLKWLHGMIEHNRKMYANTHGPISEEYYFSAMAYEKAYTVFKENVIGDKETEK